MLPHETPPQNIALQRSKESDTTLTPQEERIKSELVQHLQETGEMDKLKKRLTAKLVQSGWRDDMKELAMHVVRKGGGITQITVDEMSAELTSQGRAMVPQHIRDETTKELQDILMKAQSPSGGNTF